MRSTKWATPTVYCELYAHRMSESDDPVVGRSALPPDVARYIARSPDRFRRGLAKLGQPDLVSSFDRSVAKRKPSRGTRGPKALERAVAQYEKQVRRLFYGEPEVRSPKYA